MTDSPEQKRILVFSASFGGGHTAMARALKAYFKEHHGGRILVDVVDMLEEYAPNLNVLAKFAYQQPDPFFPAYHGTFEELADRLPGNPAVDEAKSAVISRLTETLREERPAAIIATHPFVGGLATEAAEGECLCATVVSCFDGRGHWLHPKTDLYFAAGRTAREQLMLGGLAWDRIVESGIPIREQFAEKVDRNATRRELGLSDKFTVLLRADHGKPAVAAESAKQMLQAGVQVAALTSGNERMRSRLESETDSSVPLVVFDRVEGVHSLMAACDILVSRPGGLMIPEACASGLPLVLEPPTPGQEVANVDFLVNYGAALLARGQDDVVDKVRFLSTHERRMEQMAESANQIGRSSSTQTICERVLAAIR